MQPETPKEEVQMSKEEDSIELSDDDLLESEDEFINIKTSAMGSDEG